MITPEQIANYKYQYRKRYLYYIPTEKQKIFHDSTKIANEVAFFGGNRTGKTYCGAQQISYWLTGSYPSWYKGHKFDFAPNGVCLANNAQDIREVWQDYLFGGPTTNYEGFISEDLIVKKIYSNKGVLESVHIKHESGSISQCQFKTYGQGIDKMQGKRYNFADIDENPGSLELYHEVLLRLMDTGDGKGQGKMLLTMTPKHGLTDLVAYFMTHSVIRETELGKMTDEYQTPSELVHNGKMYIHASWDESHFLSEEAKSSYLANTPPHLIDCVTRGIPVFGDGLIFPIPNDKLIVEAFDIPNTFKLFNGLDFGFKDHTAVIFFAYDQDNDTIYVYKEYKQNLMTIDQHCPALIAMGCDEIITLCDPYDSVKRDERDGNRKIELYKKAGLNVMSAKRTEKTEVIDKILSRMRQGTFKIFNTCNKLLNEKRSYVTVNGKIKEGNDHLISAMLYGMSSGLKYAKNRNYITQNTYDRKYMF